MECEVCMNRLCGASLVGDYKKGWGLRSGGFANLCHKCGTAYEQLAFCELFHLDDTGWRECTSCGKPLHCGCIASRAFLELLDNGGITCVTCSNIKTIEKKPKETGISVENSVEEAPSSSIDKTMLTKLNGEKLLLPSKNDDASRSQMKHKEITGHKDVYGSVVQTDLTIALDASLNKVVEEREMNNTLSYFQQGTWSRRILPKSALPQGLNANASMSSQIRVARPPVEGRIKNQLLPRYWPRITEQELQQISGDSNATIVPLFEKVLSASDAGRIGRLVLPKACAEAYFPPISQPEGLPLRIQDVKGNEWLFQFRFWPNNNSRMYVLEGVTPCIQSMQLQAGDTVTFSRMEPGGKLLMGFRKASPSTSVQFLKGNTYSHLNELSRTVHIPNGDVGWPTNEQLESKLMAGSFPTSMFVSDKKRSRHIGSKSKRFLIDSQDTLELIHTWEESQDMLFPPLLLNPTIVTLEDNEFEEYEEPPVFGKGSIFTVSSSGEQEQWGQCDNCSKWRRLPAEFLLPPKWTCQDNIWDHSRAACLAPDELGPRELENLLRLAKDFANRRNCVRHKPEEEQGGYNVNAQTASIAIGTEPLVAMTTKHPRHRPGCSCIVCIQPPSGKGKHNPTCTCNVCMTVKRRFKTLMLRKKKRQSEHEAKIADKSQSQLTWVSKEEAEVEGIGRRTNMQVNESSLDLNIHPNRQEDGKTVSMMSLLQVANLPLETYLKENGLASLIIEQQASSGSQVLPQETGETHSGDEAGDVDELRVPDNVQDACS